MFGSSTHTVNSIFLVEARSVPRLVPDNQSSELRWFSKVDKKWPVYVRTMLELSGF